jgi:hypothetical protein
VPTLSGSQLCIRIGASNLIKINEIDPRLCLSASITIPNCARDTHPPSPQLSPQFLIDSGATHDMISKSYAAASGLIRHATAASRVIAGFDGSQSRSIFEIDLRVDNDPIPSQFIIT